MFTRKSPNEIHKQVNDIRHSGVPSSSHVQSGQPPPTITPHRISETVSHSPTEARSHEEGLVIIGKGTRVIGSIGDCRKLDVHGVLEADIVADILVIRDGGGVKGTVRCDHAEVHGVFEGTLVVDEHLDIHKTGNISGEISYRSLSIQTGAKMRGNILCSEPDLDLVADEEKSADLLPISATHANEANGYEANAQVSPIS